MKIGFLLSNRLPLSVLLLSLLVPVALQANSVGDSSFKQTPAAEHYDNALGLIQAQSYKDALALLRRIQVNYPAFENISAVQTRIAVLHESEDAQAEIGHYLSALDKRDAGDAADALSSIEFILLQYPDSTLLDDALYLKAYVQTMDRYDFPGALATLQELERRFPESSYQDSAEYLTAISLEQMGETQSARIALETLRERHTAFTLPFGYSMPVGTVLSRYWYDRADRRLDIIDQATESASLLRSKEVMESGGLTVSVNVDGVDLDLELSTSPMTQGAAWRDGALQDQSPPVVGIFVGKVKGDDESWVRAVIVDDTISGRVYAFGRDYTMESGTLIGTLDYYQPRSAIDRAAGKLDAVSTEAEIGQDGLIAPPQLGAAFGGVPMATNVSDLRVVPLSIVVDAEFDRYHAGQGLVVALSQLNVADGIYRQFGLALAVDEVQLYSDSDYNPLTSATGTLESYLQDFRIYRQKNRALFNDSVLTYLFTGKQRTDSTLGLAWIDTLCRTDGFDVGITTPSVIGEVLLTHELGHSLGSQHDSDTACNQDTTKIMWPNISTRTQAQFSSCSSESVSHAHNKSCLLNAVDVSLNAIGTGTGVEFIVGNLDSTLSVDAVLTIETSSAGLLNLPAGCSELSPTSASCVVGEIGAGEEQRLVFSVASAGSTANAVVTGVVSTLGITDFNPADNTVTYSVDTQSNSTEHLILASNSLTGSAEQSFEALESTTGESGGSGSMSKSGLLVLSLVQLFSAFKVSRSK